MQSDTIPDMPPPPEPAPAPGTLRLQGKVIGIHTADNSTSTIYEVQVLKTLGMGAGTPAVVRNDMVSIISSKEYPEITEKADAVFLIKHEREMTINENSSTSWQLLEWELKSDRK